MELLAFNLGLAGWKTFGYINIELVYFRWRSPNLQNFLENKKELNLFLIMVGDLREAYMWKVLISRLRSLTFFPLLWGAIKAFRTSKQHDQNGIQ